MSGPCRILYRIKLPAHQWSNKPQYSPDGKWMKCWSREEGERAIKAHKMRRGDEMEILDFQSPPTRPYAFDVYRRQNGETKRAFFHRKSRRDAEKWAIHANRLFGSTHDYKLVCNYQLAQERKQEVLPLSPPPFPTPRPPMMAPPRQPIPPITRENAESVIKDNPAAGLIEMDMVKLDPMARAKPLPTIEVGDTIVARHTVTHAGGPSSLCGVKIGGVVVGFEAKDILEVIKLPVLAGQKRSAEGIPVYVDHVTGDYAMVTPTIGDKVPFVCHTSLLKA